jgi:predicted ATPase
MFSLGHAQQGLAQMRQGFQATLEAEVIQLRYSALLAAAMGLSGEVSEGLATVTELLARAHRLGELEWAPEMHRVKGELLVLQGSDEAEACFQRSISLAHRQGAKSLELRTGLSLTRLWRQSGKIAEARKRLSQLYGWFTEGFDMPDLVTARNLLDELSLGA